MEEFNGEDVFHDRQSMSFQAIMDQEQGSYNGNVPETGGNDRNMSTDQMGDVTSSSSTVNVRSVRYLVTYCWSAMTNLTSPHKKR